MKKSDTPTQETAQDSIKELKATAEKYGLEFVTAVSDEMLCPELVAELPVEWARTNALLPVKINGKLCVLTSNPNQVDTQEYLALLMGEELRPVLALPDVISQSIERCYYRKQDSAKEFIEDMGFQNLTVAGGSSKSDDLLQVAEKSPVTQLVNLILLEAVKRNASDIHFEPFESRLRVRYRIDGVLFDQTSPPKHMEETLVSRLKVMARMDIAEKRLPQDGMAKVRVGDREIDMRVSTVPVAEGERVVLRILDRNSALLPLDVLGMSRETLTSFNSLLSCSSGIIIVAGPTGSGKTTTLYAALGQLNSARKNILTIEDPIEYQLPDIGQIQVKPKIGLTFANGLRHILRQDPDIILVGETRDVETADIAIRASLTGHLVFTTLHTNDAPGAVPRLVDMGVQPYLLASCLKGVLAQRLVRKLCPLCKKEVLVSPAKAAEVSIRNLSMAGKTTWDAVGCQSCLEGYKGRTGLFEIMLVDREMQDVVRSGNVDTGAFRDMAEAKGMASIMRDGLNKVLAGVTSLPEVLGVMSS